MKVLLKGGRVIDPAAGRDGVFDVLIDDGRIAVIDKDLPRNGCQVIEIKKGWKGFSAPAWRCSASIALRLTLRQHLASMFLPAGGVP